MASIVKTPRNNTADYDFIAFSFDGKHSIEDFGIYRVSDGNAGYNMDLSLSSEDKTATVPGMDGKYYLGSQKKEKVFNIKIAFDNLTEEKLGEVKTWLNTGKIADLWFAEAPHKVYGAKVTGLSTATTVTFDENEQRVYKGTGSIQFTCYNPYAHTPDWVQVEKNSEKNGITVISKPGNTYLSYRDFSNYEKIKTTLPLYGKVEFEFDEDGNEISSTKIPSKFAFGDQPFYFKAYLLNVTDANTEIDFVADISGEQYRISGGEAVESNGKYTVYVQDIVIQEDKNGNKK